MPEVRIKINPAIFEWVIEATNINDMKNEYKDDFFKWKSGEKTPTFNQLERFSKGTSIPFGYFFLENPPIEKIEILEYRTIDSLALEQPSRNLIDTINKMEDVQEWMKEYAIDRELGELDYVGFLNGSKDVQKVVTETRNVLSLSEAWFLESSDSRESFNIIREKLEEIRTIVMMSGIVGSNTHRPLDIYEFRAFTLIDNHAPLIFINASDSFNGRLFSLLHEFIHIEIGKNNFFNDIQNSLNQVSETEILCNAVTAEIIAPLGLFQKKWLEHSEDYGTKDRIFHLARYFRCGVTIIARRALDSGLIDGHTYTEIAESAISNYKKQRRSEDGGGNYYNTLNSRMDKHFLRALNNSMYEGKTSATEAYRLTNTNRETFSNLLRMIAGN